MKIIDKVIISYLKDDKKCFFGHLLIYIRKKENKSISTIGVYISNGDVNLTYNPDFLEKIKRQDGIKALKGILEHELLHLVFDHISRAKKYSRNHNIYNIATDMAINQRIDKEILPESLMPSEQKIQKFKNGIPQEVMIFPELYNYPENKSAEFYYNKLLKEPKNKKYDIGNIDDHSVWKKTNGESESSIREATKVAVREAVKRATRGRGTIPADIKEVVNKLLNPPTVNWRHLLKQYIGGNVKTGFKRSWKRRNRRFPNREDLKGKTANRTFKLLWAIDTSGSVNPNEFNDCLSEIKGMLRVYKAEIDVLLVDSDIQKKLTLKPYSKLNVDFTGRGGTSFKPVFDYLQEYRNYDVLVYFTDGYCDYKNCNSRIPVIWVFTENGSKCKPPFGRLVKIKKGE